MTALETLEYAQSSVDQIERGLGFVQERLDQAESLALKVDDLAVTAGEVAAKARRISKFAVILGGVVIVGGAVACVIICKRRRSNRSEESTEILT